MIYEIFISINKRLQKSFSMVIMTQNFCGDLSKFKSTNLGEPPYPGTRKTVTQCCQSKPQGGNEYFFIRISEVWEKPIQSPQHPKGTSCSMNMNVESDWYLVRFCLHVIIMWLLLHLKKMRVGWTLGSYWAFKMPLSTNSGVACRMLSFSSCKQPFGFAKIAKDITFWKNSSGISWVVPLRSNRIISCLVEDFYKPSPVLLGRGTTQRIGLSSAKPKNVKNLISECIFKRMAWILML